MTSPARAFMSRPSQRSILKRSAPSALSPTALPFHASFSMLSPGPKSPHVHFMHTPQLVATFVTHSSENYDRAPIKVSPNPLALPERGARFFSPTVENFKLAPPPPPKAAALQRLNSILKTSQCASPAITDFPDPRSPQAAAAAAPSFQQIRFASFAATRQPRDLAMSMSSYPRSPYPSAPLSPVETMESQQIEGRARRMSDPSAKATRSRSHEAQTRSSRATVPPSPLKSSFKPQGLQRSHKPTPLALNSAESTSSLSNAFWDAMTLEGETPMVTALEYPESAVQMEDIDLQSPSFVKSPKVKTPAPALMFGGQDGSVWSPSAVAPKKTAARDMLLRSALMSPAKAAFTKPKQVKRAIIASPSPNDPFAAFPSFAAALTLDVSSIPLARPSRVLQYA